MRRPFPAIVAALTLIGCTDLLPPPAVDPYEYRMFVPADGGGTVPMAFKWPRAALPVRIHVEPASPLHAAVVEAMATWQGAFVYGEVRTELVADSATADVIVRNEIATKLPAGFRLAGSADGCLGQTDFDADVDAGELYPPFRIRVWAQTTPDNPALAACYRATVLHELGHALGIFEHSPSSDDVMNVNPTRSDLSERDRATIEAVYHLPTTLTPVR